MLNVPKVTERALKGSQQVISSAGDSEPPSSISRHERFSILIKIRPNEPLGPTIVGEA